MDSLKNADELLTIATRLLDEAAKIFASTDLSDRREQIERIGNSLAFAFQAQQAIYKVQPELEPEWLKAPPQYPEENREYGRMLLSTLELWKQDQRKEAVERWREYLAVERPELFREMATRQLHDLEKLLGRDGAA